MARRLESLGIPVVVGEDRFAAGLFAEASFGVRLHLLDDGFQHRQLARDFDIVLVSESDASSLLLPAGPLREPPTALARADVAVGDAKTNFTRFPVIPKWIWRTTRTLALEPVTPGDAAPLRPVAFCGIGNPQMFFQQLRGLGLDLAGERAFGDHHAYRVADVAALKRLALRNAADGFVTTKKDLVNLGALAGEMRPLWVARLQVELRLAEECVDRLLTTLAERGKPAPTEFTPS